MSNASDFPGLVEAVLLGGAEAEQRRKFDEHLHELTHRRLKKLEMFRRDVKGRADVATAYVKYVIGLALKSVRKKAKCARDKASPGLYLLKILWVEIDKTYFERFWDVAGVEKSKYVTRPTGDAYNLYKAVQKVANQPEFQRIGKNLYTLAGSTAGEVREVTNVKDVIRQTANVPLKRRGSRLPLKTDLKLWLIEAMRRIPGRALTVGQIAELAGHFIYVAPSKPEVLVPDMHSEQGEPYLHSKAVRDAHDEYVDGRTRNLEPSDIKHYAGELLNTLSEDQKLVLGAYHRQHASGVSLHAELQKYPAWRNRGRSMAGTLYGSAESNIQKFSKTDLAGIDVGYVCKVLREALKTCADQLQVK